MATAVGGSVSWLASNGLNLTVATSRNEDDNPAAVRKTSAYGKIGYITGKHAVALDFDRGKDFDLAGDESGYVGVGYVYTAAKWLDLYAGAKQHKLDRPGADFDNITFVTGGGRLKF
ncbi:MAG: porin [Burkholderiaceae bacterium]|nr:porin [Burkholderiaceae bacterium]